MCGIVKFLVTLGLLKAELYIYHSLSDAIYVLTSCYNAFLGPSWISGMHDLLSKLALDMVETQI